MTRPQCVKTVDDNKFHVIVGFLDDQIDEAGRGSFDSSGILSEGCQCGRCFILDSMGRNVEEFEDAANIPSLGRVQW